MGNLLSRNDTQPQSQQLKELENRLISLEAADKNADGKLSKNEFRLWKKEQKADLEIFKQKIIKEERFKHQKELLDKENRIKELEKELEALKELQTQIQAEAQHKLQKTSDEEVTNADNNASNNKPNDSISSEVTQKLSEAQIRKFVEELLEDQNINISIIPDWAERQLYINFFNLLIGLLKKTVSTTSIKFMGHQVTLDMRPG